MNIVSKFTVGSEKGIDLFLALKEAHLKEIYDGITDPVKLRTYIEHELDRRAAINDLNDLSTRLIVVFDDDQPAGYAIIRNAFDRPGILEGKRAVHLSFFILSGHNTPEVRLSLWQKCLSVTRNHAHWTELPAGSPIIPFLETADFTVVGQSELKPFSIPSQIMVRRNF